MVECNKRATQTEISMSCHVMTILSFFGWFVGWWVGRLVGPWVGSEFNKKKGGSCRASVPTLKRFLPTSLHGCMLVSGAIVVPRLVFGDTLEGVSGSHVIVGFRDKLTPGPGLFLFRFISKISRYCLKIRLNRQHNDCKLPT